MYKKIKGTKNIINELSQNIIDELSWYQLTYLFNKKDFVNYDNIWKIKMDKVSIYSITPYRMSLKIIDIMNGYINIRDSIITDACACVGGDSINFIKRFKFVNSIELSKERCDFLKNNLKLYPYKNYKIYNEDCLKRIKKLKQDIIYLDLPWDGKKYKYVESLNLSLNNIDSSKIVEDLIKYTKIICFKIPKNFNINDFRENIKIKYIYQYKINKFNLLIIFNKID
jgi:hypothetical protein